MFKKKPQLKPYTVVRSSDRRKIAQSIIDEFHPPLPQSQDTESTLTELRNSLLPDEASSAKFTTSLGPNLDTVAGTIYFGVHAGDAKKRPLWVKLEGYMLPTVYTLWKNPKLLPLLHTHQSVMEKLYTGADLMIPGLIGPPFPAGAAKGKLVAIASSKSPTVALAVGIAEIDVSELSKVVGEKGKAVRILHWYGDEIWSLGGSGGEAPEKVDFGDDEEVVREEKEEEKVEEGNVEQKVESGMEKLTVEYKEGQGEEKEGEIAEGSKSEDTKQGEAEPAPEKELTTKDIDAAFVHAALYGIHSHIAKKSNTSLQFPITSSVFISNFVLPFLPPPSHFNAETGSMCIVHPSLQLKKTSWKNAAKFLKQLDKDKLIKSKTRGGGEVVVQDIDWSDDRVKNFTPYKLPIPAPADEHSGLSGGGQKSGAPAPAGPLRVLELYKPSSSIFPILGAVKAERKEFYTSQKLRSLLTAYLETETETVPTNKRLVKVNPVIADSLLNSSREDTEILSQGVVKRDLLAERFVQACSPYYVVLRPGEEYPNGGLKPHAGPPPKVTVLLESKRMKNTTKVTGLEAFKIDLQEFREELKRVCAGSTSVSQVQGSSPKNPLMEVMVQGAHEKAVKDAVVERGVPGKCVVVVDKRGGNKAKGSGPKEG
ncbi:eukaryotic translation initiation factor SUI1 family protein [Kalaharituber pfeilii]|nr:eukaryotic translation initiation factor SUI1 family protein [Kalaharituber pfeilii]